MQWWNFAFAWAWGLSPLVVFFITWIVCAVISPGMMWVLARLVERRKPSLHLRDNYLAFLPGDLVLGAGAAAAMATVTQVQPGWYTSWWLSLIVLGAAIAFAVFRWLGDLKAYGNLSLMLSPTKLYHDVVLYIGWGYGLVTVLLAACFSKPLGWFAVVAVIAGIGIGWLGMMIYKELLGHSISESPWLWLSISAIAFAVVQAIVDTLFGVPYSIVAAGTCLFTWVYLGLLDGKLSTAELARKQRNSHQAYWWRNWQHQ